MGAKIRLFTHNDLDGYASYIVARCYFKKQEIFVQYCTCDNVADRINHFMNTITEEVEHIFITDLSIKDEELLNKLEICNLLFKDVNVKWLDHHKSSLIYKNYDIAEIKIEENNELICGSKLFYNYLINELKFKRNETLEKWLKFVNDYDTWLWEDKYNYVEPKEWNELFYLYDKNTFIDNVLNKIKNKNINYSTIDNMLLKIEHEKQNAYIKSRIKSIIEKEILGYKCVIIFAEQYINELATEMYKTYPKSEIQIIITGKTVSFRVRNKNLNIDLNAFASKFNGGGHESAAAALIPPFAQEEYINNIFRL